MLIEDWHRRVSFSGYFYCIVHSELAHYFLLCFFLLQKSYWVPGFWFYIPKHLEEKKEAGSLVVARHVKWISKGQLNSVGHWFQFIILLAVGAGVGAWSAASVSSSRHGQTLVDWERPNQDFRDRVFVLHGRHMKDKIKGSLFWG